MATKSNVALALVVAGALAGCASIGWRGAEAEKQYDKDLEARRLAEVNNNDDYFEIHEDGRIFVLSDVADYRQWRATGEIPLGVTRIGAGPNGETVKMALIRKEAKVMESKVGFKGGAQRMYEGELAGIDKGFYGEVQRDARIHVFSDWRSLDAFRKTGAAAGATLPGMGPKGETVVFVQGGDAAAAPPDTLARFKAVHELK
jgi:hypothetical protein